VRVSRRRKGRGKAASESCGPLRHQPSYPLCRAPPRRVGATTERAPSVRRRALLLQRRSASPGVAVEAVHLAGDGVSRVPHVGRSWVEQPEGLEPLRYKTWYHGRKPAAAGKGASPSCPTEPLLRRMRSMNDVRLWNREAWRAVCAETCQHGSGRGTRHPCTGQRSLLYQWFGFNSDVTGPLAVS